MPRQPTFSNLAEELKIHIFSFLDTGDKIRRASLVCKEWNHLMDTPSLWTSLELSGRRVTAIEAADIVANKLCLKTLVLKDFTEGADHVLRSAAVSCNRLKVLELVRIIKLDSKTLNMVADRFPQIEEVVFFGHHEPGGSAFFADIFAGTKLVTYSGTCKIRLPIDPPKHCLSHVTCPLDEEEEWPFLMRYGGIVDYLEILSVDGMCRQQSYRHMLPQDTTSVAIMLGRESEPCPSLLTQVKTLSNLRELRFNITYMVSDRGFPDRCGSVILPFLSSVLSRRQFPYLTKINLFNLPTIDDTFARMIAYNCANLTTVILNYTSITMSGLVDIVKHCTKLQVLSVKDPQQNLTHSDIRFLCNIRKGLIFRRCWGLGS